ncbi:MAG: RHS repeat domain-containing protein [Kiritimatiellia bacterium]
MTRFRHFAIVALALMACPVSAFAHIPRDVLEPTVSLSDICVHPSACASTTADRRPFVVLSPNASRLTRIQYHNGISNFVDRVYTLDAHGNTMAMEVNAGLLPQVTPQVMRLKQNGADELTTIQTKANPGVQGWTDKTPVHDAEGNLTSDGDSTFGYDYENRLATVVSGADSTTYYYVGDGSRVAAVTVESGSTNTTVFVLDHADPLRRPLAELDANGALIRRFVWGRGVVAQIEANGTVHYFHHDGQGSTLALSDTNNVPTDQWFYSPYGEIMSRAGTTETPYQWCGGMGLRPAVGNLYFARHRYYHAGLRRWTARDPAGIAGGANLYAYAFNAPWLYYDPWGLCPENYWETGSYWGDVGQVFMGYGDTVAGMAQGLYQIARHPVQTARGIGYAATNPGQTWDAISSDYVERAGSLRGQGSIVGEVLVTAGTLGAGAATSGGGKVGQTAKIINTIDAVVPEEIAPYVDDMATVSRWGGEGLRSGQWVMKGKSSFSNYLRSGKWDPFPWNDFAPPSSGQTFLVPKSSVKLPQTEGVLGKVKAVTLGQRQYIP